MSRILLGLIAGASLTLGGAAAAATATGGMSRDTYNAEKDKIQAQYKMEAARCNALAGNAKDVCVKEAKGREKTATAELDASFKNTDKARFDARTVRADAEYDVAKERCDDLGGNPKAVCLEDAKAAHTRAIADAKVARVSREETAKANAKIDDQRRDALKEKRDADYGVAREKCDALAGAAKDRCLDDAKMRYGKT